MRTVNIADLKNNLSRYLNEVRSGTEVIVKDRNRPIARIVPLETGDAATELTTLIAEGVARPPKKEKALPKKFWTETLPKSGVDLGKLLREDRDAR